MTHDKDLVMVAGGVDIDVQVVGGKTEKLRVRILAVDSMQIYMALIQANDEGGLIDLFLDKPSGFFKTLTAKSQADVIELGEELNADFMMRCAARVKARREKLTPGFEEKAMKALNDQLATFLPKLLPKPEEPLTSSPGAASDKSEPSTKP